MPTNQCVGLDDHQRIAPIDETRKLGQRETNRVRCFPWFIFSLDVKGELLSQKQILGGDISFRSEKQVEEPQEITYYPKNVTGQRKETRETSHRYRHSKIL